MSYSALEEHFRRLGHLQHATAILSWDEAVIMPPASGRKRAETMGTLQVMIHEQLTAPALPALIARAEEQALAGNLTHPQVANVREIRRAVQRAQGISSELVARSAEAQLRCEQAWRTQRKDNDFAGFLPLLTEVVSLRREAAAQLGEALGLTPYDALLDEYEPGCKAEALDRVFASLRSFLPALTDEVLARQAGETVHVPRGPFPIPAQRALGEAMMRAIGFDAEHGRLDVSHHPFCGGVPSDVRITTRYKEHDFTGALMGVLHETGHAKYEQGLPSEWGLQPVGAARGMAMHEGQSLCSEMQVSRSREFLEFLVPHVHAAFPDAVRDQPEAYTVDNLYRFFTRVERSKIRVDADEVTYPSHILVRYELERKLIAGSMHVSDLPDAWDAGMRELLQIGTGDDYRDGCMQDVHWPSGAFGYFPTYTLGALTAAQLFQAAVQKVPSIPDEIRRGSFTHLNDFLRDAVWSQASILPGDELLRRATGETLDARYFEAHLRRRYLSI
ncbi:MAG: Carboxypeptidase Taq [Myxococcaceae bacterium]|nr:Carboxypeptidase Taq [Myxococcaceae bacterium]